MIQCKLAGEWLARYFAGMTEPIPVIDLTSDAHFMGDALRQARLAFDTDEVPVG